MVESPAMQQTPGSAAGPFSVPNLLTYGRILAVPAIVIVYYFDGYVGRWLALAIFIAASITDFLDGYLARIWKQQSAIGRMLDPIADKLLVATTLLLLVSDNTIGGWSLLAGPAGDRLFPHQSAMGSDMGIVSYIGLLLLWVSALVTLYTGYDYFRAGIRHLLSEES